MALTSPLTRKPTLAVFKFASCDGCQLSLLDAEDELLAVAEVIDIANFVEASREVRAGPLRRDAGRGLDHDRTRRCSHPPGPRGVEVPRDDRCMCDGGRHPGVAQLEGRSRVHVARVRQPCVHRHPRPVDAGVVPRSRRLRAAGLPHLQGAAARGGDRFPPRPAPTIPTYSVCMQCKQRGTTCVMVADGTPCLGPVTQAGCGAICPAYNRGCYGCFGPMESPNTEALSAWWKTLGVDDKGLVEAYRGLQRMGGRVPRCFRST